MLHTSKIICKKRNLEMCYFYDINFILFSIIIYKKEHLNGLKITKYKN